MREIKFRAWDTTSKSNPFMDTDCGFERLGEYHEMMGHKIMQYTGLKDKNGTDIYEGDILDNGCGDVCAVKFGEHLTMEGSPQGWYVEWPSGTQGYLNCSWSDDGKVIGNIHENPELLNG